MARSFNSRIHIKGTNRSPMRVRFFYTSHSPTNCAFYTWWRHQMETFSALLTVYAWNKAQQNLNVSNLVLQFIQLHVIVHYYGEYQSHNIILCNIYTLVHVISQQGIRYISGWFMLHIWTIEITYLDDLRFASSRLSRFGLRITGILLDWNGMSWDYVAWQGVLLCIIIQNIIVQHNSCEEINDNSCYFRTKRKVTNVGDYSCSLSWRLQWRIWSICCALHQHDCHGWA